MNPWAWACGALTIVNSVARMSTVERGNGGLRASIDISSAPRAGANQTGGRRRPCNICAVSPDSLQRQDLPVAERQFPFGKLVHHDACVLQTTGVAGQHRPCGERALVVLHDPIDRPSQRVAELLDEAGG